MVTPVSSAASRGRRLRGVPDCPPHAQCSWGREGRNNDRMSDPTSTGRLGVTVTPRRPGFDFEGLEYEVPRAWHPAGIGPTAFLETLSAIAPVVEGFFIADARRLLPRIADEAPR